jgi:two-component system LytT family response regulator
MKRGKNSSAETDAGNPAFMFELEKSKAHAAFNTFEIEEADMALQPLAIAKLFQALKEVFLNHETASSKNSYLFVKVDSRLVRVDFRDIFHIEAMSDYVHIYTREKKYTVHSTMKGIKSKLPETEFSRVHKSFIVRNDCISEIEKDTLTVENNIIPISLSYRKQLKERLNII